jgi:putative ABC transport system ATP-binding protein
LSRRSKKLNSAQKNSQSFALGDSWQRGPTREHSLTGDTMNDLQVVKVENVFKDYLDGRVKALRGVSMEIPQRAFIALAGPSGSGKTTLLNLIGVLDVADSGDIVVADHNVEGMSERERTRLRRETIGFVFQSFNLVPVLTAVENVELPLEIIAGTTRESRRKAAMDMLARVGLDGMEHRFPSELSGGQQQRIAIARSLVKHPALVLADEPTANLDGETGAAIIDLMKQMRDELGTSFIFSTHDPRLLERTESIIRLEDGCIRS